MRALCALRRAVRGPRRGAVFDAGSSTELDAWLRSDIESPVWFSVAAKPICRLRKADHEAAMIVDHTGGKNGFRGIVLDR